MNGFGFNAAAPAGDIGAENLNFKTEDDVQFHSFSGKMLDWME